MNVSIRNLDDEVAARLRQRAARNGRSTEAEIRDILTQATRADSGVDWRALALRVQSLSPPLDEDVTTATIREARDAR
jgi:plasmid stability protein